jgi:electron transport complex protein RnfD
MKEFKVDNGPHMKDSNTTSKMMKHLFIALLPIIIFSYIKTGLMTYLNDNISLLESFRPFFLILICAFTSLIIEILWCKIILKKKPKKYLKESYSLFPGIFLALVLPLYTPYYIAMIGAAFATIFGKLIFGGFGKNIFNPALTGRIFVTFVFATQIINNGGYLNGSEIDAVSSATPLSTTTNAIGDYSTLVKPFGSLWDFFTGFIPGSLGETSALLCLIGLIYLLVKKVISWRVPVIYIGTVFILTYIIGISNGFGIWYPLFHILSGGLMFGAVFMATDPVSSPTVTSSKVFYAVGLGVITVFFRFLSVYPEGVAWSILIMNFFSIPIDFLFSRGRYDIKKIIIPFVLLITLSIFLTYYIINSNKEDEDKVDNDFKVNNIVNEEENTIYSVTYKGYHSDISADITVNNNEIINKRRTSY